MRVGLAIVLMVTFVVIVPADGHCKYRDAFREMFFTRQPGARGEAMGRGGVALTGDILSSFYNPAGLVEDTGLTLCISGSSHYYSLDEADYLFLGGSLPLGRWGAVGLSRYRFEEETTFIGPHGPGNPNEFPASKLWLYALTYAAEPSRRLYIGANPR